MKKTAASSRSDRQSPVLRGVLPALCVVLAAFAFVSQPPRELLHGFWQILISDAGLITDPAVTGGAGAALLNAALVLALSTALVYAMHLPVTGLTFACLFMMAGFSLLGKNLLNILPVLLGGWLYAKFQGEPFSKYIYQTLFSTCLSPLVSFWLVHLPGWWCIPAMLFSGVAIGFFVPPIAGYTVKLHQGFDLYNVGFAAGFLGLGIASICKGLGVEFVTELQWGFEDHETSQVLNCFRVYRSMNQICDVGMTKHVWRNLKIQAIYHMTIVPCFFTQLRVKHILHIFPVHKFASYPRFCCPCHDILPKPLKLRIRQRLSILVGNYIV